MVEMSNGEIITDQDYRDRHDSGEDGYDLPIELLPACDGKSPAQDELDDGPGF